MRLKTIKDPPMIRKSSDFFQFFFDFLKFFEIFEKNRFEVFLTDSAITVAGVLNWSFSSQGLTKFWQCRSRAWDNRKRYKISLRKGDEGLGRRCPKWLMRSRKSWPGKTAIFISRVGRSRGRELDEIRFLEDFVSQLIFFSRFYFDQKTAQNTPAKKHLYFRVLSLSVFF